MKEFDKVVGYKSVKTELERIIDMMINQKKYSDLGIKTTRGLLLYGKPGVGKTLMSKCFMKASKRKAFTIRKDIPDGEFVKYIKDTFEKARKEAPSIVFLDDMDKFANEDSHHKNAEEYVTIQACIDEVKGYEVFVLATANDLDNLPDSLLRPGRFDKNIEVKAPTGEDAEKIVRNYLKKKKVAKDLDYKEIVRFLNGKSCAALETVINEAGVYSGYENKDCIDMEDIIKSFMRVVYDAPEHLSEKENKYIRNTSVHEAGHAVVGEILEPDSISFITVKKHDGSIDGFTSFNQSEDYFEDISFMENRVMSLLAGKAATEIVYGKPDVGCINDIERAFAVVGRFVGDYCCYGFNYWTGSGFHYDVDSNETDDIRTHVVHKEIEAYYQKAKKILLENREFLDKLTDELVEKKTITYKDIQRVKAGCTIKGASC